jgi:hypothetical protein
MANVTSTSTKGAIWDAYLEQEKKVKELEAKLLNPAKEVAVKKAEATVSAAEKVIGLDILNPKVIEGYTSLKEAIALKQQDIKELFEIETNCYSLAALINAQNTQREKFDAEVEEKKAAYTTELNELLERISTAKETYAAEVAELKKANEQSRKREEEEYKYTRDRDRKIDKDKWEDEKAKRERELAILEEAVKAREQIAAVKEENIAELENQVKAIPSLEDKAKAIGIAIGKSEAKKEYESQAKIEKAQSDADKSILQNRVNSLEAEKTSLIAQLAEAKEAAAAARSEVKEIASQAVQSAGNSKTVDMMNNLMLQQNQPAKYSK